VQNYLTKTIKREVISEKKIKSVIKLNENCFNVESHFLGKVLLADLLYKIATYKLEEIVAD
jgi:hypothetical protein